jgi:hypothetical protein
MAANVDCFVQPGFNTGACRLKLVNFILKLDITAKVYHHFSAKFTTDMDLL